MPDLVADPGVSFDQGLFGVLWDSPGLFENNKPYFPQKVWLCYV
jgi:hypothetical protein